MINNWLWIIGGGLLQIPLVKEARALGLSVLVTDLNPQCPARSCADRFEVMDIFDIPGNLQLCDRLRSEGLGIAGVLAAGIDAPETMAVLNENLGLRGVTAEIARLTQQKDLFREAMKNKGYPTPGHAVVRSEQEMKESIDTLRFPLIAKPPANSASRDMKIFELGEADVCCLFITNLLKKYDRVLLEELWHGEEQTVECLVDIEGSFHRGSITDRKFTFEGGFPVETGLVHPTELSETDQESLYRLAEQLASDFRIEAGAVKLDTMMTDAGPRVIEMAVRHSGGFDCQFLVPLSTGKNILQAAIYTAIQKPFPPELLKPRWSRYGVTGSVWPKPGVIKAIEGVEQAVELDGIEHIFFRYEEGDEVLPYIDCSRRTVFIIAVGNSRKAAKQSLEKAQDLLQIVTA